MLAAGFTCFIGLAMLYTAWRDLLPQRFSLKLAGWLSLGTSSLLWTRAVGWEFGITYFFTNIAILAWLGIALNVAIRKKKPSSALHEPARRPSSVAVRRNLSKFFAAFPLAGIAAAFVTLATMTHLSNNALTQMAGIALGMPTLWGLFMVWCCVDTKLIRPAGFLLVAAVVAALTLL